MNIPIKNPKNTREIPPIYVDHVAPISAVPKYNISINNEIADEVTIDKITNDLALVKRENQIKFANNSSERDQRGVFDGKIVSVGAGVIQGFGSKNILNKVAETISAILYRD